MNYYYYAMDGKNREKQKLKKPYISWFLLGRPKLAASYNRIYVLLPQGNIDQV